MIKILHVAETVKGGVATYLNEISAYKSEDVYLDVSMLIPQEHTSYINSREMRIYSFQGGRTLASLFGFSLRIVDVVRSEKPDIIYAHSTFAGFLVRTLYPFYSARIKIIYCSHGWATSRSAKPIISRLVALSEKLLSRVTDVIINISEYDYAEAIRIGIPEKKCILIEHGISDERKGNGAIYLDDKSKLNLLFVGRMDYQKGIDILLKQLASVSDDRIHLYVIGEPVVSDLKLEWPSNATYLGWMSHDRVLIYYDTVDAVVVPSRWEGFGLVVLEAMRAGKAVIASNRGALPSIVQDGETGIVVDLDAKDCLSSLLGRLDKDTLRAMGKGGRQRFLAKYTSESMNRKLLALYRDLMPISEKARSA